MLKDRANTVMDTMGESAVLSNNSGGFAETISHVVDNLYKNAEEEHARHEQEYWNRFLSAETPEERKEYSEYLNESRKSSAELARNKVDDFVKAVLVVAAIGISVEYARSGKPRQAMEALRKCIK